MLPRRAALQREDNEKQVSLGARIASRTQTKKSKHLRVDPDDDYDNIDSYSAAPTTLRERYQFKSQNKSVKFIFHYLFFLAHT